MLRKLLKKRVAVIGALAALIAAGGAYAYFTGGSGSATGSGTVGTSAALSVTSGTPTWSGTLAALYPGATNDTEYLPFTVTNNGSGHQAVSTVTATVAADSSGNAETSSGTSITGCLASWFTATVDSSDAALPADLAPGGTYTGKVDLTMQDVNTSQNNCKSAQPAVTIQAS
jgi:hypothetical protein